MRQHPNHGLKGDVNWTAGGCILACFHGPGLLWCNVWVCYFIMHFQSERDRQYIAYCCRALGYFFFAWLYIQTGEPQGFTIEEGWLLPVGGALRTWRLPAHPLVLLVLGILHSILGCRCNAIKQPLWHRYAHPQTERSITWTDVPSRCQTEARLLDDDLQHNITKAALRLGRAKDAAQAE